MKLDWQDFAVVQSRATAPYFYHAPYPEELPYGMEVMDFQLAGAEYRLARHNGLIGDQPGLTKTAQSIMVSNAMGAKRTLAVVPASLRLNWEREIWAWSTQENVSTYPVLKSSDGVSGTADWVIVSYDMLRNDAILSAILDMRWDHLILDEAHYLKDPKGNRRTQAIGAPDGVRSVVGSITALSGTILPNQPIECYNVLRLLDWEAINEASVEDFREYFYELGEGFVTRRVWNGKQYVTKQEWSNQVRNVPRRLDELQWILRKNIMVRRLKEQVLHELPEKVWHPFPLVPTADIKRALKHPGFRKAQALYELDPDAFDRGIPIDGEISTALRELGEAKAPAVADYVEELLLSGVEKVIVGAWHRSVLAVLRERLDKYGLTYMDGNTSSRAKQLAVDRFQNEDCVRVILGQLLALGEGWTLTQAQDAVLGEFYWVPGKNDQFLDRIHRMGQKGSYVTGHVPLVPGSLDERVIGNAIWKDQNIYSALDRQY